MPINHVSTNSFPLSCSRRLFVSFCACLSFLPQLANSCIVHMHHTLLIRAEISSLASLGLSLIDEANQWDDCSNVESNTNTFIRARAYRVFLTSCGEINRGSTPRGPQHPQGAP